MTRLVLLSALVGALLLPSAAQAEWHYTRAGAQKLAREAAERRYGSEYGIEYATTVAVCRPQGERYNPRFKYHRWVCGWAGEDYDADTCSGSLVIVGSRGRGAFYHRVERGIRCYYAE